MLTAGQHRMNKKEGGLEGFFPPTNVFNIIKLENHFFLFIIFYVDSRSTSPDKKEGLQGIPPPMNFFYIKCNSTLEKIHH